MLRRVVRTFAPCPCALRGGAQTSDTTTPRGHTPTLRLYGAGGGQPEFDQRLGEALAWVAQRLDGR